MSMVLPRVLSLCHVHKMQQNVSAKISQSYNSILVSIILSLLVKICYAACITRCIGTVGHSQIQVTKMEFVQLVKSLLSSAYVMRWPLQPNRYSFPVRVITFYVAAFDVTVTFFCFDDLDHSLKNLWIRKMQKRCQKAFS